MNKILYTSFDIVPAPKGSSVHISYFTKALVEGGYRVTLLTPLGKNQEEREVYLGAKIKRIKLEDSNFLKKTLLFSQGVEKELERNYDIVQFRSIWGGLPAIYRKKKNYKIIYEANGFPSIELPYHYPWLKKEKILLEKFRLQEIICLQGADIIICPSEIIKKYIISLGIIENKIIVIPNGVNTEIFKGTFFPPLPLKLLYVGTLTPWQGIQLLLKSLSIIKKEKIEFTLNILSDRKRKFEKLILELAFRLKLSENLNLLNPLPQEGVSEIISNSHICLAPLEYTERNLLQGCCPIKILEYMACGRPVVSSDIPCVREILEDGIDGILCNCLKEEELAEKILYLSKNLSIAKEIGIRAINKIRGKYTWHKAGQELIQVLKNLI